MIGIGRSKNIERFGTPRVEESSKPKDKEDYPKNPKPGLSPKQDTVEISKEGKQASEENKNDKNPK